MKRTVPDARKILLEWDSDDPQASARAEAMLKRLGPAPLIPLIRTPAEMESLDGPIPRLDRRSFVLIGGCLLVLMVFINSVCLMAYRFTGIAAYWSIPAAAGLFGALGMINLWRKRDRIRQAWAEAKRLQVRQAELAAKAFAAFEEVHWVEALLTDLLDKDDEGGVRVRPPEHPIYDALERLLPQIYAAQAADLLQRHRRTLLRFLDIQLARRYSGFILSVLEVLARFGDSRYLRQVETVADSPVSTPAGTRVRDAARACDAAIKERIQKERTARALLRPSNVPAEAPDLLRPAASVQSESEQLLRPGEAGDQRST